MITSRVEKTWLVSTLASELLAQIRSLIPMQEYSRYIYDPDPEDTICSLCNVTESEKTPHLRMDPALLFLSNSNAISDSKEAIGGGLRKMRGKPW